MWCCVQLGCTLILVYILKRRLCFSVTTESMLYCKDEEKFERENEFYNYYASFWSSAVDNSAPKQAVKIS